MSDRVEPQRVFRGVAKRWRLFLTVTAIAAVAGYQLSRLLPQVYAAETSILVGQPLEAPYLEQADVEASQELALTYADVIQRQPVLSGVVERLRLETSWPELQEQVRAEVSGDNAQLILVTVHASSPGLAAAIAGVIPSELDELVPASSAPQERAESRAFLTSFLGHVEGEITRGQASIDELREAIASGTDPGTIDRLRRQLESEQRLTITWQQTYRSLSDYLAGAGSPSHLVVLEPALAERDPVSPNVRLNVAVSVVLGLLLAFAISYAREFRRERTAKRGKGQSYRPRSREYGDSIEDGPQVVPVGDGRRTSQGSRLETARPKRNRRRRNRV